MITLLTVFIVAVAAADDSCDFLSFIDPFIRSNHSCHSFADSFMGALHFERLFRGEPGAAIASVLRFLPTRRAGGSLGVSREAGDPPLPVVLPRSLPSAPPAAEAALAILLRASPNRLKHHHNEGVDVFLCRG